MPAKRFRITSRAASPNELLGAVSFPRATAAWREERPRPVCCQNALAWGLAAASLRRQVTPAMAISSERLSGALRWQWARAAWAAASVG